MKRAGFKFKRKWYTSTSSVFEEIILKLKNKEKANDFMKHFREYSSIADSQLSKHIQNNYVERLEELHSLLSIPIWEAPPIGGYSETELKEQKREARKARKLAKES